jgi:hypothetical protein
LLVQYGEEWLSNLEKQLRQVRPLKAEALGNLLQISQEERELLGIRTIRAAGMTDALMKEARRKSNTARMKTKRAETRRRTGWPPTTRGLSLAELAPWDREGVSRATWFRHHPKAERDSIIAEMRQVRAQYEGERSSPESMGMQHIAVSSQGSTSLLEPGSSAGGRSPEGAPSHTAPLKPAPTAIAATWGRRASDCQPSDVSHSHRADCHFAPSSCGSLLKPKSGPRQSVL